MHNLPVKEMQSSTWSKNLNEKKSQEAEPAKQNSFHDLAEDETTPDDDNKDESEAISKLNFDMPGKNSS